MYNLRFQVHGKLCGMSQFLSSRSHKNFFFWKMTGFMCMQIHVGNLLYWPLCVWVCISEWHNVATCTGFLAWKCLLHSLAKRVSALVQWTQICLLISAIKLQWDAQAYHVGVRIITWAPSSTQLPWLQWKVRCQLLTSCLRSPASPAAQASSTVPWHQEYLQQLGGWSLLYHSSLPLLKAILAKALFCYVCITDVIQNRS